METALIQCEINWNDPHGSCTRITPLLEEGVKRGAKLIVLPEMFCCGFSLVQGDEARSISKIGYEFLLTQAKKHDVYIVGSLPGFEQPSSELPNNTLVVAGPTGELGRYSKVHLFSFSGEDQKYLAGTDPLTLEIEGLSFSFFICYDLRFPEAFASRAAGTEVFVVVANWPERRHKHWELLLAARAVENQAYVVGVNRVGTGGGLSYRGGSQVLSPSGETIVHCGENESVSIASIKRSEVAEYRSSFPTLKDRRTDLYRTWVVR